MAWRRKQNLHFGHWYVTHFHFSPFRLHPQISYDLEWVVTGWTETGCDLWWDSKRKWKWYRLFHFREEVRSDDFFWNRMAFMYCLKQVFHLVTVSFCTEFTSLTEMSSWHWSSHLATKPYCLKIKYKNSWRRLTLPTVLGSLPGRSTGVFHIKHRKNCECCPVSQLIVR